MASSTYTLEISSTHRLRALLSRYFYFFMSLLVLAVVVYGFGQTVNENLIHAVPVRPSLLYLHAVVFFGWVTFFIVQSALVRVHKVSVHRTLGWVGVGLGVIIPVLGVSTGITMDRFRIFHFHETSSSPFLAIQLLDMTCFSIFFALAVLWRRRPEFHRRSILIATCVLTSAAFARFPFVPLRWSYVGVDSLILLGIARDLVVNKRAHQVYRVALPLLMAGQATALYLFFAAPKGWVRITDAILR
jgi:hypothetical protein